MKLKKWDNSLDKGYSADNPKDLGQKQEIVIKDGMKMAEKMAEKILAKAKLIGNESQSEIQ